jgi:hypothetical protein
MFLSCFNLILSTLPVTDLDSDLVFFYFWHNPIANSDLRSLETTGIT